MSKKELSIIDNPNKQGSVVDSKNSSLQDCNRNIELSSDYPNYGRFHVIAIVIIVLIFLMKISSTSTPIEPNHERLSSHTTERVNNSIATHSR